MHHVRLATRERGVVQNYAGLTRRAVMILGVLCAVTIAGCRAGSPNTSLTSDGTAPSINAEAPAEISPGVAVRISYGTDSNQFGDLTVPDVDGPAPVVVLIHDGFWRTGFGLDLMDPLVPTLIERGYAVWNIEYRRIGGGPQGGGGYPETFDDAAASIDALATLP